MRWVVDKEYMPRPGETQIVKKFLMFPLKIRNEVRWLEIATIQKRYVADLSTNGGFKWINSGFM